ncbi:unnamed protein product [Mytilus coruscus]|uniref:Uncharacterized protein n=1 Tax=Mytilus coruscus TaxID=42192 RepID=A0A6J8C9U1_MYTCO|nr:unnamed protein product [Mytilus coruscus]
MSGRHGRIVTVNVMENKCGKEWYGYTKAKTVVHSNFLHVPHLIWVMITEGVMLFVTMAAHQIHTFALVLLEVTCGDPGSISNGNIDGNQFTYGDTIKYNCNTDYMLIDGSLTRTCQLNGLWNGTKPSCAFFNSCSSIPCQNNGNCTNVQDSYTCQCENGWSGKNCEIDVQPPVMSNCSNDMKILTSDLTKSVEWTIPDFTDPHNTSLSITENYVINNWTFPWGDYNISYSALKAVNGHVTECLFEIKIRPFPCQTLSAPLNGALLCNNWKTDYGQYCLYWCQEDYTVARGVDPTSWFICGASGSWFPGAIRVSYLQSTSGYKLANVYRNCTEEEGMMQAYYINKLKESEFSYFCNKFHDECTEENTAVLLKQNRRDKRLHFNSAVYHVTEGKKQGK